VNSERGRGRCGGKPLRIFLPKGQPGRSSLDAMRYYFLKIVIFGADHSSEPNSILMRVTPVRRKRKKPIIICTLKSDIGENHANLSLPDVPELRLIGIQIFVGSRKPATAAEIENARAKFKKLLRKQLPLKDGRCVIPIGENMAEVITQKQKPVSKEEFEEVFRHINNFLTVFPEKIDKTTKIFEEAVE
jgi:hypothetical protein